MSETVICKAPARGIFPALFAELLRAKGVLRGLLALAGLQVALVALGLPGWPCPVRHGLGVPCPGCGLSRALAALLHGDWRQSLQLHAFAPVFAAALTLLVIAGLLPTTAHRQLADGMAALETRTGLTLFLAAGFLAYWLARLFLFPGSLALVMQD